MDVSITAPPAEATGPIEWRRILIYIGVAFGWSYLVALFLWTQGGLVDSPEILPGFLLYTVLVALLYMPAPAIAHVATRAITREGFQDLWLAPKLRQGWPYWLIAWFGTPLLVVAGAVIFYVVQPQFFDPSFSALGDLINSQMEAQGLPPLPAEQITLILVSQVAVGVFLSPILNALFIFGEEFGWRGYLIHKLMPLGGRAATLISGVIWGAWHFPLIAMGHNYGLGYSGAPWLGMAAMTLFTIAAGTIITWMTLKSGSIWPAVIAHGSINGFAAVAVLPLQGSPNPLIGPSAVGVLGGLGFILAAVLLFIVPGALDYPTPEAPPA